MDKHSDYSLKMKNIPVYDRPYEKLESNGERSLTDTELLAILIKTGSKKMSAMDIAQLIMREAIRDNDISYLSQTPIEDLIGIPGIGRVKAITIKAAIELGRRSTRRSPLSKETIIKSPSDIVEYISEEMEHLTCEEIKIVLLDSKNAVMKISGHSCGTVNEIMFSPRIIFKDALKYDAASIIIIHNHPSGSTKPSQSDINTTKSVMEIGENLGVGVLDHIIVAKSGFTSIRSYL